jgi:hypothetical protein
MISLERLNRAVVKGMEKASQDSKFSFYMLMDGKKIGGSRERWLCEWVCKALVDDELNAQTEEIDRIDISIIDAVGKLEDIIEAKFLWCHDCYQDRSGHQFFVNVRKDKDKRAHYGVPQKAIVFAANYESMGSDGRALDLYHANAVKKHLDKHSSVIVPRDCCGFERFEKELFGAFRQDCDILPRQYQYPTQHTWPANHLGASKNIRAWVLSFRT